MADDDSLAFAIRGELREKYRAAGYWNDEDFWTSFEVVAARAPDAIAFVEGERAIRFGELRAQAARFGSALRAARLAPGAVLALHARHCIESMVAILGCMHAGVVVALLPPMFSVEQIQGILAQTGAHALLGLGDDSEIERTVAAAHAAGTALLLLPDAALARVAGATGWSAFLARGADQGAPRAPVSADALMLLIYSSGTTGAPKGVMHCANTVRFTIRGYAALQAIGADDVSLVVTAFGFVGSSVLGTFLTLLTGCRTVLLRNWNVESTLRLIEQHRVTHFLLMPTHAIDILAAPQLDRTDCSSVSRGVVAGINEAQRLDARRRLCARPFPMYGMSESPGHVTGRMDEDWEKLRTTEGRWLPGTELLVCDDDDRPLPAGTTGNILVRGPNRFLGYFRAAETNRAVLTAEGFFRTGDVGFVDAEGYMTFQTRSKDIIRRGGVTITPADVENALRPHPRIRDVSVIALPDPRLGERACACVITTDGADLTLEELTAFLDARGFARYQWPEHVRLCESFPRTPSLKVQKNELRRLILERDGAG